jgi:hypothetical protein
MESTEWSDWSDLADVLEELNPNMAAEVRRCRDFFPVLDKAVGKHVAQTKERIIEIAGRNKADPMTQDIKKRNFKLSVLVELQCRQSSLSFRAGALRDLLNYIDTLEAAVTNAQKQSNIDLDKRRQAEAALARLRGDVEREARRIAELVEEPWDL